MKKIALALVIACGMTTINATQPAPIKEMTLDERVRSLALTRENARGILSTLAEHKVLTAIILSAIAAVATDAYSNDWKCTNASLAWLNENVKIPVSNAATYAYTKSTDISAQIANNKAPAAAITATIALLVYVAYDLTKEEDKSALKKLVQKLFTKKVSAPTTPVVA